MGGAVRDILQGRPVKDKDYLVLNSTREEFTRAFPDARRVGKSFPVFIRDGDEYAFPRGPDLDSDLAARDLTVNAMALFPNGRIHAHPKALADLKDKILRPTSLKSFLDDPVRVYRAARLKACMPEFRVHPELIEVMKETATQTGLTDIIPERVGEETLKALAGEKPGEFLDVLNRGGCLAPWFAELEGADDIPAGPPKYHDKSVLGHTRLVMDRLAGDALRVWMGLVHDLGKTATDPGNRPHHFDHDVLGRGLAEKLGLRLRLPTRFIKAGAAAAALHMRVGNYHVLRPGTRVDLLDALHKQDLVGRMFDLAGADNGPDNLALARQDLKIMLSVELPEQDRDRGEHSAKRMRELRANALANLRGA